MAGNLTPAAAAAVVAINETMSLLRLCLSPLPSQFLGVEVGIGVDHVRKLIALIIIVAMMAMGTFTAFIGYNIRRLRRQRGMQQQQQQQQQLQNVMSNRNVIREDHIEDNRSLECNQVRLNVLKTSLRNVMNNIVLDRDLLLKHYRDISNHF